MKNYIDVGVEVLSNDNSGKKSAVLLYTEYRYAPIIVIESGAYFEAYMYVLNRIKELDTNP